MFPICSHMFPLKPSLLPCWVALYGTCGGRSSFLAEKLARSCGMDGKMGIWYHQIPGFAAFLQIRSNNILYIYIHIYHNHQLQALCCETDSCGVSFLLLTCGLYGGSIFPTCEAGRLVGGVNNKCVSVDPSQTKVWYLNHKSMEKTRWDYVTLVLLNNINMFCSIVFWASPGVVTQHSSFITSAPHRLPSQSPCRRGAWSRFGALEGGWLWRIS